MVDTLAFLKNDYTEEEIQKIVHEIETYVEFFGGYSATILKTTDNTVYRTVKEGFEIPQDAIVGKLPADMFEFFQKLNNSDMSYEEFNKLQRSTEYREFSKTWKVLANDYILKHNGYNIKKFTPNKYVINARLNVGAYKRLARLLDDMGIEYTDIVQWWGDEFDENTAFQWIDSGFDINSKYAESEIYNFWFVEDYTNDEIMEMYATLEKAFRNVRYGLYEENYNLYRATSDTVIEIPILSEYKKFISYEEKLFAEIRNDPNHLNFGDEKWLEKERIKDEKIATYRNTHHIYNKRKIEQGQIVLRLVVLCEDFDAVKNTIQNAGYTILFDNIACDTWLSNDDFEHIREPIKMEKWVGIDVN